MAGNFRSLFASHENFHPRKLMPVQLYVRKADQQGAWPKHRGSVQFGPQPFRVTICLFVATVV